MRLGNLFVSRADAMSLVPQQFGKLLTSDVTTDSTLTDSHVSCTSRSADAAAELAASVKFAK